MFDGALLDAFLFESCKMKEKHKKRTTVGFIPIAFKHEVSEQ